MEQFQESKSGEALRSVQHLLVAFNKYTPLHVGCYIPLPESIRTKKRGSILNVRSDDRKCFMWCVIASLFKIYSEDVSSFSQNYHDFINLKNIQLPINLHDLKSKILTFQ